MPQLSALLLVCCLFLSTVAFAQTPDIKALQQKAGQGDVEAMCDLGDIYRYGEVVPTDNAKALALYLNAAKKGSARGQGCVGFMYDNGRAVTKDKDKAIEWYSKATAQGDATAMGWLASLYYFRGDKDLAIEWYKKAHEAGNEEAAFWLSRHYKEMNNDREQIKWVRVNAEKGSEFAMAKMGSAYQEGKGVLQDYTEARKWYRKSADHGYYGSLASLGAMYRQGLGGPKDDKKAIEIFEELWLQATEDDQAWTAAERLPDIYLYGELQDYVKAYAWLNIGSIIRDNLRDQVAGIMKLEQIEAGQKLSREWLAKREKVQAEKAKKKAAVDGTVVE